MFQLMLFTSEITRLMWMNASENQNRRARLFTDFMTYREEIDLLANIIEGMKARLCPINEAIYQIQFWTDEHFLSDDTGPTGDSSWNL